MDIQSLAEDVVRNGVSRESRAGYDVSNGALVAVVPWSGQILCMVGSVDFNDKAHGGEFNVAVNPRQPGSSIKPVAYAEAFEKGWYPSYVILDYHKTWDDGTQKGYTPNNFNQCTTARSRYAIRSNSHWNIPALHAMEYDFTKDGSRYGQHDGLQNFVDFAHAVGIKDGFNRPINVVVVCFWVFSTALLNLSHLLVREGLRFLRRRGKNLRHVVVVGAAVQARRLVHKLDWYRHLGLSVVGVHLLGHDDSESEPLGVPLIGNQEDLVGMVRSGEIDQVFVTFPLQEAARLADVQDWLGDEPVTLFYVPDLGEFAKLRGRIEEFEDLQIVTLQASPLDGWNTILKRAVDLLFGFLTLILFSPLMALIALAIKLTSPGPGTL